jgi:diguanylate cyclase (GGDEF)-like protein
MTLPVSTLPKDAQALLLASGGAAGELQTAEGTLLARSSPLDSVGGEVHSLLLRSVDEVVAPYRQLQVLLAIITVAGVLLFAVGTGLVAQRLATPLRSLLAATQRLSRGEYDLPLEHTDRTDEIGNLARSFDHMRVDIGARQTEIRRLAYWDRLTGLPNRERFRDAVVQAIAASASTPQPLAVLTLDLDRFKHVNDVLGYAFGDRLLQAVAERLSQQVRSPDDMVARLGGNEFAILLQRADAADAHDVAQRINQSFELPLAFEDQTVDLSAGIGFGPTLVIAREDLFGPEMNCACKLGEDIAMANEILLTEAAWASLPTGRYVCSRTDHQISGMELHAYRFDRCLFDRPLHPSAAASPTTSLPAGR